MFGVRALRARIAVLEQREFARVVERKELPKSTVTIPVVDAEGEPILEREVICAMPFSRPKRHTLTLQQAFDQLQDAVGTHLVLEQGADDSLQVYED